MSSILLTWLTQKENITFWLWLQWMSSYARRWGKEKCEKSSLSLL